MSRGNSGESNPKKTLYTLSYRKNELPPSRYCDCVTAPVKFRCLVMFVFYLFVWLFVCRSRLSLIKSLGLLKPEAPSRVCVIVTNCINTPRAHCVKKHVYGLVKASVSSALLQSASKISLKAIENCWTRNYL